MSGRILYERVGADTAPRDTQVPTETGSTVTSGDIHRVGSRRRWKDDSLSKKVRPTSTAPRQGYMGVKWGLSTSRTKCVSIPTSVHDTVRLKKRFEGDNTDDPLKFVYRPSVLTT